MIAGRPTGKRERYYFGTEKEAKKAAADRTATCRFRLANRPSRCGTGDGGGVYKDARPVRKNALRRYSLLPGLFREDEQFEDRIRALQARSGRIRFPPRKRGRYAPAQANDGLRIKEVRSPVWRLSD